MNDIENTMDLEINPYDILIEKSEVPVQSPVILKDTSEPEAAKKPEMPIEILPLAESANYKNINISEYTAIYKNEILVEEDILVPDTYSDVETILNLEGSIANIEIAEANGTWEICGEVKLEMMYRSADNFGNNVCVVPASIKLAQKSEEYGAADIAQLCAYGQIGRIDYRLINERKYKAKVYIDVEIKGQKEKELSFFEGINGEQLYLKKDNIKLADYVSRKTRESEIREDLLLNDEKIRPVKILKTKVEVAENHRQFTKDKLILNQTIWIRIMYLAEVASKGNLSNMPMFFQSKIDNTQFIAFGKNEKEIAACITRSSAEKINVDINKESNGFEVSGEIITDVEYYDYIEKESVTDFYHNKEEMTCDWKEEKICAEVACISVEQTLRDSIGLPQESGEELRVIYTDAQIIDRAITVDGVTATVKGRLQLEAVIMNEGDHTILAKKICDFTCVKELPGTADCRAELSRAFVREIKCDISGKEVEFAVQIQVNMNIYNETKIIGISNPCFIRSGEPAKCYPITIHTVKIGESIWDIGKRYKVGEDCITAYNKPENIKPGKKIIIVK